jgi:ABC-type glycerol-3-phosphate transport system substrate-binding protein
VIPLLRRAFVALTLGLGLLGCEDPEEDSGVRRIVYWEKWTGFEGEAMQRVVDEFNAQQREKAKTTKGYRPIEVEKVTVSKLDEKLIVAIAGGNPPDISGAISFLMTSYVDKGALRDLTRDLREAGLDERHFAPAYFTLGEHHGRIWSVPLTPSTLALHYNPALFREAGLDPETPPETLEELDAMAEKLTRWEVTLPDGTTEIQSGYLPEVAGDKKRLLQVGFLPSEPGFWQWGWGFHFGGQLVRGDRITAADPGNVRALEWVASYSKNLGVDKIQRFRSSLGKFASPQNPFLSGKVAMEIQGVWMFNFIEKFAPGMQWRAAPFPHPADLPELKGPTDVEADILVIPSGSKHPEEALEFLKFAISQEMLEKLCLGQKKHSPLREMSDEFRAAHPHPYLELFRSLSFSEAGYYPPKLGIWGEYLRTLAAAIDEVQNLTTPPAEALRRVEEKMQAAYDRELRAAKRRANQ